MPTLSGLSIINDQLSIAVGYYGSALLIGLGNGHMWPAFQNMTINVAANNQRGTANSTILISWDIGMGLGILVGGIVSELLGYDAAFWTVVLVNAAGVACFFFATKAFSLTGAPLSTEALDALKTNASYSDGSILVDAYKQ